MNEQGDNPAGDENAPPPPEPKAESLQFDPVGARLTDRVADGTLSTGVIILDGPDEFILDFIQGVAQPSRVAARIVMSPRVVGQFLSALKANLQRYEQTFGKPPELPRPDPERRPNIKDVYDSLKMSDDKLSGAYANAVRIGHAPSEFCFDFITRFFPTAAVSARVYMTASHVPRLLESLTASYNHYLSKTRQPPRPPDDMMM